MRAREFEKIGMLSGGIGITPLRSMCKYCTDMRFETKITLLHGNQLEKIFRKEFEEMQVRNKNLKVVFTVSEPNKSWMGQTGRISAQMIETEIPDYVQRVFYTCGPPRMVEAMENLRKDRGVPQRQIKKGNSPSY